MANISGLLKWSYRRAINVVRRFSHSYADTAEKKVRDFSPRVPEYLNEYPGRTFLVLGTGPMLGEYGDKIKLFIEKHNAITIGGNHITPFIYPDYHAISNRNRFVTYAETFNPKRSKVLLSPYLPLRLVKEHYTGPYQEIMYLPDEERDFDIKEGVVLAGCRSIVLLGTALAIVMGGTKIFIAGMDGYRNPNDYFTETTVKEKWDMEYRMQFQEDCEKVIRQIGNYMCVRGLEGPTIITPTAYEEFYRDINCYL